MNKRIYSVASYIILVTLLTFSLIKYVNEVSDKDKKLGSFYSSLYLQLEVTTYPIKTIQNCYATRNFSELIVAQSSLITELRVLNEKLVNIGELLDNRMFIPDFVIMNIISAIKGIAADGVISENEIMFINQLYNDLEEFKNSLSINTITINDNSNKKLSINDYSKILINFEMKWTNNNSNMNNPYKYLHP